MLFRQSHNLCKQLSYLFDSGRSWRKVSLWAGALRVLCRKPGRFRALTDLAAHVILVLIVIIVVGVMIVMIAMIVMIVI